MTWARLDDNFHSHPSTLMAGLEANGLFARGLSYCAHYLTDGFIPREWAEAQGPKRAITRLVTATLWEPIEDGFIVVGYLKRNPSRSDLEQIRGKDVRKHALHRDRELVSAVRSRDGSSCRYCGTEVDWTDRRGSKGGTYDHVDPVGENTVENIVVACRGCNSTKGKRTPDQAGIKLRPNPDLNGVGLRAVPGEVGNGS